MCNNNVAIDLPSSIFTSVCALLSVRFVPLLMHRYAFVVAYGHNSTARCNATEKHLSAVLCAGRTTLNLIGTDVMLSGKTSSMLR